jgi:hypothetical protein
MSIMERIFGAVKPASTPNVPGNPGVPPNPTNNLQTNPPPTGAVQSPSTAPNGVIPNDGSNLPGVIPEPKKETPEDKFKSLWETPPPEKNETPPANTPSAQERMLEAAGKVDFSKVIDQEDLAKIAAGGQDAVQALVKTLNKTAQTVYGQSTVVAHKMVERAVEEAEQRFAAQVPGLVKRNSAREGLLGENPAFTNPAIQPLVAAIQTQIMEKNPKASQAEINQATKEYFGMVAGVFSPPKKDGESGTSGKKAKDDVDWDEWMKE